MSTNIKFQGTGSLPFHLNINNTAKELSNQESTNIAFTLMEMLNKNVIIEDNIVLINPQIENNLIIIR